MLDGLIEVKKKETTHDKITNILAKLIYENISKNINCYLPVEIPTNDNISLYYKGKTYDIAFIWNGRRILIEIKTTKIE